MNTNTATQVTTTTAAPTKARCYSEYCCNAATEEVELLDRSGSALSPILWGWCGQHFHMAWSQRTAK